VGRIAQEARVRRLVLTHFRPASAAMIESIVADVARDYTGPIILGTDLLEITV
jgi:ribonuclease Z